HSLLGVESDLDLPVLSAKHSLYRFEIDRCVHGFPSFRRCVDECWFFVEPFAQTILPNLRLSKGCYPVVIGCPEGLAGVSPIPLREFLMAGGAEFGKITAAGSAAGAETPRRRAGPNRRKMTDLKTRARILVLVILAALPPCC